MADPKTDRRNSLLKNRDSRREHEEKNRDVFFHLCWIINGILLLAEIRVGVLYGWVYTGFSVLLVHIVYTIASLRQIAVEDVGNLQFLGRPIFNIESGIHYVPFLVCNISPIQRAKHQVQIPADDSWRGKVDEMPAGKTPVIRVTHSDLTLESYRRYSLNLLTEIELLGLPEPKQSEEKASKAKILKTFGVTREEQDKVIFSMYDLVKTDPLNKSLTSEPVVIVTYDAIDSWAFLESMGGDFERVDTQIEDLVVSFLTEELTKRSCRQSMNSLRDLSILLEERIDNMVFDWGLDSKVTIKSLNLSHELNTALQSVPEARAAATKTIIEADATKEKKIREGQGEAGSTIAIAEASKIKREKEGAGDAFAIRVKLDAETVSLKQRATDLGTEGGRMVLGAEVAKAVSAGGKNTYVLGTEGISQLVGLGAVALQGLQQKPAEEKKDEKKPDEPKK